MTKEEQIKIYSAYLPYGLEFFYGTEIRIKKNIWKLIGLQRRLVYGNLTNDFKVIARNSEYQNNISMTIELIKPILYPVEYLSKEIEHEGERFVPIVELLKIKYPNQKGRYAETEFSTIGYPFACFSVDAGKQIKVNTSYLNDEPFWIIQKLISWHLNVFGLPESEFINKATLTNK